jgi:hypothetical protein
MITNLNTKNIVSLVYNRKDLIEYSVTDLATRGHNLLIGHQELTKLKGHILALGITCIIMGT